MTAIIDYGVGNLFSLKASLASIGEQVIVTSDPQVIRAADRLILPGVGAFSDAAKKLESSGLQDILKEEAAAGKPLLGICLGMQLLFEKSYEYGEHSGLSLLKGSIVPIKGKLQENLKIPHIGWNSLDFRRESPLFKYIKNGDFVYFVHSFFASGCAGCVIADTQYGINITAAVSEKNIFGCQFHPEKSGETGLKILKAFCEQEKSE